MAFKTIKNFRNPEGRFKVGDIYPAKDKKHAEIALSEKLIEEMPEEAPKKKAEKASEAK